MKKKDLLPFVIELQQELKKLVGVLFEALTTSPDRAADFPQAFESFSLARKKLVDKRYEFIKEASIGYSFVTEADQIEYVESDGLLDLQDSLKKIAEKLTPFVDLGDANKWNQVKTWFKLCSSVEGLGIIQMYNYTQKHYDMKRSVWSSSIYSLKLDFYAFNIAINSIVELSYQDAAPEIKERLSLVCALLDVLNDYIDTAFNESNDLKYLELEDDAFCYFPRTRPIRCRWESLKSWWGGTPIQVIVQEQPQLQIVTVDGSPSEVDQAAGPLLYAHGSGVESSEDVDNENIVYDLEPTVAERRTYVV